jgi:NitT/TauT family transport system substrate-binding protein
MKILSTIAVAVATVLLAGGCASTASPSSKPSPASATAKNPASSIALGYFANVTHAPALVALQKGFFTKELGATKLTTEVFNAGPATIEALSSGAIDAAYIGPSPSINSFIKSAGESLRVVSGAAYGGAELVVRANITRPAQLKGTTLATPQLGNTQDVALRSWLKKQGLTSSITGGGDVAITPTDNAQTLALFQSGHVDGAWLPEPWASQLVLNGGAHVLVDEATLWPGRKFTTTELVVNTAFLNAHPATVSSLVAANLRAVDWLNANPSRAGSVINAQLTKDTGKPLPTPVITRSLKFVHFSVDPLASTANTLNSHAVAAGTGTAGSLKGLFDLRLLNDVLRASGAATVSSAGLGKQ